MKAVFSISFLFGILFSSAQTNWLWANGYSSYGKDYGTAVAVDAAGNAITIGSLHSWSLSCGSTLLFKNGSLLDFVVLKHDPNGNLLWAKSFGGTFDENATGITTDPNGNILICGSLSSALVTFGSFTVSNTLGVLSSFVLKLSPAGNVLWVKTSSGQPTGQGKAVHCAARAIAADSSGNCCIVGNVNTSSVSFGTVTLNQPYSGGAFLVKYDANGNELWGAVINGSGTCLPHSVACNTSGDIHITGYVNGGVTFGGFPLIPSGPLKCFIAKCDPTGNVLWANVATGTGNCQGEDITCDVNGNVVVAGAATGSINFGQVSYNSSTSDPFLLKLDPQGNVLWGEMASGAAGENSGGVVTDNNANILWTGRFWDAQNPLTFGNVTLTPVGKSPGYITRYDANGNLLCADYIEFGGYSNGVAINSTGDAYLCSGYSTNPFVVGNDTLTLPMTGAIGHYIAKWNCGSLITGIEKNELKILNVFPVPVDRYLHIGFENDTAYRDFLVTIKNSQCQVVYSSIFSNVVDCSFMIPGIYFIELSTPQGEFFCKKFVKQ